MAEALPDSGRKSLGASSGYGAPIMVSAMADRAASTWDNLIVLRLFGERVMGAYALSYSLAATPLIYVAERMGDVFMPAFSKMEPDERPAAVVRGAGSWRSSSRRSAWVLGLSLRRS